jgi:hypothetical protein
MVAFQGVSLLKYCVSLFSHVSYPVAEIYVVCFWTSQAESSWRAETAKCSRLQGLKYPWRNNGHFAPCRYATMLSALRQTTSTKPQLPRCWSLASPNVLLWRHVHRHPLSRVFFVFGLRKTAFRCGRWLRLYRILSRRWRTRGGSPVSWTNNPSPWKANMCTGLRFAGFFGTIHVTENRHDFWNMNVKNCYWYWYIC